MKDAFKALKSRAVYDLDAEMRIAAASLYQPVWVKDADIKLHQFYDAYLAWIFEMGQLEYRLGADCLKQHSEELDEDQTGILWTLFDRYFDQSELEVEEAITLFKELSRGRIQ